MLELPLCGSRRRHEFSIRSLSFPSKGVDHVSSISFFSQEPLQLRSREQQWYPLWYWACKLPSRFAWPRQLPNWFHRQSKELQIFKSWEPDLVTPFVIWLPRRRESWVSTHRVDNLWGSDLGDRQRIALAGIHIPRAQWRLIDFWGKVASHPLTPYLSWSRGFQDLEESHASY
mgnify:CR=1 FL=1